MQRSGAITPRRAAWARSKREVWVGKRSATWRAISAPVAVMPMNTGPGPVADAGAGLLAERGVRLVADHDRVGVGDAAGVADEPLVGLDRDRAVGVVGAVEQRRREAVLVAAVGDLADELVDEVAAVGEDQDAAGARGLDEADRGDGLAGAGRVLEPEAAARARVLGGLGDDLLVLGRPAPPSPGGSSSGASASSSSSTLGTVAVAVRALGRWRRPCGPRAVARRWRAPCAPGSSSSAMIAARVPESASTWCSVSSAPSSSSAARRRAGARGRAAASSCRRHSNEGASAPASSSASAASTAQAAGGARERGRRASRPRAGSARG